MDDQLSTRELREQASQAYEQLRVVNPWLPAPAVVKPTFSVTWDIDSPKAVLALEVWVDIPLTWMRSDSDPHDE